MNDFQLGFFDELEKIAGMLSRLAKTRQATGVLKEIPGLERMSSGALHGTPTMRAASAQELAALEEATTMAPQIKTDPMEIVKLLRERKALKSLPPVAPPSAPIKREFYKAGPSGLERLVA
jgi:hypothetical protein